jgi:hypothetical protein
MAVCAGAGYANPFDAFTDQVTNVAVSVAQYNLDSFANDLGPVLAGSSFHQGRSLGFPGFDIGIHAAARPVAAEDAILESAGVETLLVPLAQLEIGLPAKFDLIGRFTSYVDATVTGAGLRYGILRSKLPGSPSLSVQAIYTTLAVDAGVNKFSADTVAASAVASVDLPVVQPYLGVTYVSTTVRPDAQLGLPQTGMTGTATGYVLEGGVNVALFPLTYLQLGGALSDGNVSYVLGLGVKY